MRLKKYVLCIVVLFIVFIAIFFVIHHYLQKYPSPSLWYSDHKNELFKMLVDDEYYMLKKKFTAINRISKIGSGIYEFSFNTLKPETTEFLIISDKPLVSSWISEYLQSEFLLPTSVKKDIPSELLRLGYYKYTGVGASSEKREGFIEYTLVDDCCIYCKMYIPT